MFMMMCSYHPYLIIQQSSARMNEHEKSHLVNIFFCTGLKRLSSDALIKSSSRRVMDVEKEISNLKAHNIALEGQVADLTRRLQLLEERFRDGDGGNSTWQDFPDDLIRCFLSWLSPKERAQLAPTQKLFNRFHIALQNTQFNLLWREYSNLSPKEILQKFIGSRDCHFQNKSEMDYKRMKDLEVHFDKNTKEYSLRFHSILFNSILTVDKCLFARKCLPKFLNSALRKGGAKKGKKAKKGKWRFGVVIETSFGRNEKQPIGWHIGFQLGAAQFVLHPGYGQGACRLQEIPKGMAHGRTFRNGGWPNENVGWSPEVCILNKVRVFAEINIPRKKGKEVEVESRVDIYLFNCNKENKKEVYHRNWKQYLPILNVYMVLTPGKFGWRTEAGKHVEGSRGYYGDVHAYVGAMDEGGNVIRLD